MTTGIVARFKGRLLAARDSLFHFGKSGVGVPFSGNIYSNWSAAGIGTGSDTTEDTLDTYSLPANALDKVGRELCIEAFGTFAANTHTKTVSLYFGSEKVTSGAVTNSSGWALSMLVGKTGASTQMVGTQAVLGAAHQGCSTLSGAETDTSAITIKVTGQSASGLSGDILLNGWSIRASN